MNVRIPVIICLSALALMVSCRRPDSFEQFIRADGVVSGAYVFTLGLDDTLATYDISFYTKVDPPLMAADRPEASLGLVVVWAEGDGLTSLREKVYLPYGGVAGSAHPYRSGIKPSHPGEWTVSVTPEDPPAGLRGIGIICKRNGTR